MDLDLQEKTDFVLKKVQSEDYIKNPLCLGISDNLLNFLARNFSKIEHPYIYPIEEIPDIEMKIYGYDGLSFRDMLLPCLFKIDPLNNSINMSVNLRIEFYIIDTNKTFAVTNFIVTSKIEPFMGKSHKNFFSFNVNEIEIEGTINYPVLDETLIIDKFGSVLDFKEYVENIVGKISNVHNNSEFSGIVPSVFLTTEFPYVWRYVEGFEVRIEKFQYAAGTILGQSCGYLFLIFSVESLRTIPPCTCPTSLKEADHNLFPDKIVNFSEFKDEDLCITIGVSEAAIREIFYPYTTIFKRVEFNTRKSRQPVTGEAFYWIDFRTKSIDIYLDGIGIDCEFKAGGSVLAYVNVPKFPPIPNRTHHTTIEDANIRFTIENISARATVSSKYNPQEKRTDFYIKPHVEISKPNVEIEGTVIPFPISEVAELLIEDFSNKGLNDIENKINTNLTFGLFPSRNPRVPGLHLIFKDVDFYSNSSVVVTTLAMDD
ncbi:hypothetical protein [Bacillus cereus]|uniref:hypothetical protein n=1 Tax=Bacillus cereus TaxID=1396 RepID=UPI00345BCB62